jgi:N-formylglutamate amidohydrolase
MSIDAGRDIKRLIELERADAARQALDDAANMLEGHHTNELYQKALKLGASLIRAMNHKVFTQKLNDDAH